MRFRTIIATFVVITLTTALPGPQEPSAWLLAEETCDWAGMLSWVEALDFLLVFF